MKLTALNLFSHNVKILPATRICLLEPCVDCQKNFVWTFRRTCPNDNWKRTERNCSQLFFVESLTIKSPMMIVMKFIWRSLDK